MRLLRKPQRRPALLLRRRVRDERGALTPAVVVMSIGLLLLGGLVTDGGRQLNAKLRAQATAEEAARAGATMLDLRQPEAVLDEGKAGDAVAAYCERAAEQDPTITTCEVSDFGHDDNKETDFVEVHVEITIPPLLFGIIGVSDLRADVTARASAVQAVKDPYHDVNQPPVTPKPEYPTTTLNVPITSGTEVTSVPVPTQYTTVLCGATTALPVTVGLTCTVTTSTPTPPPPPKTTETTTVFSPYPTSVSPSF